MADVITPYRMLNLKGHKGTINMLSKEIVVFKFHIQNMSKADRWIC